MSYEKTQVEHVFKKGETFFVSFEFYDTFEPDEEFPEGELYICSYLADFPTIEAAMAYLQGVTDSGENMGDGYIQFVDLTEKEHS